jgi:hypothetical protein
MQQLSSSILAKIEEQIVLTNHLISLVPPDQLDWRPLPDALRVCELLGHLLECLAGFCALLHKIEPGKLSHFDRLRSLPVNHCCGIEEAMSRIRQYELHIVEGFRVLSDDDLSRRLATVFVTQGEPVLTLFLGNLEHLVNHKYQLFFYLKLLGVAVSTRDLYKFRDSPDSA